MTRRRWTVILAAVLALFVLACTPKGGEHDGKSQPAKHGGPGQAQPPQNPGGNPNVDNPGPVQGDPSAHDPDPEYLEMHATWRSETKANPSIEYSVGGGQIPATNLKSYRQSDGTYLGTWVFETPARSGTTYGFSVFGTASFKYADCVIVHHGQFHSHQVDHRNCASSYTVP